MTTLAKTFLTNNLRIEKKDGRATQTLTQEPKAIKSEGYRMITYTFSDGSEIICANNCIYTPEFKPRSYEEDEYDS